MISRTAMVLMLLSLFLVTMAGCTSTPVFGTALDPTLEAIDVRHGLPMRDHADQPVAWDALVAQAAMADVILIGESHDDRVGHRFQRAFVDALMQHAPGTALSMEMLDRREQSIVDDYLAGVIDRDTFIEQTASTKWRRVAMDYLEGDIKRDVFAKKITTIGWPDWMNNYQPIVDVAKEHDAPIIAANAPWARYSKFITEDEGYEPLRRLTPAQQSLVAPPPSLPEGEYRERFFGFMSGAAGDPMHGAVSESQMLNGFRKQVLYDATMADSIVNAIHAGVPKVVHLVGQFHSDYQGGTVDVIRQLDPSLSTFTISMQDEGGPGLREEDHGRADVVVFTAQ